MAAPRALPPVIVEGCTLPYHNTHFEDHSRLHSFGDFGAVYHPVIFGTQKLVVTPLHKAISDTISAVSIDDIIKILTYQGE